MNLTIEKAKELSKGFILKPDSLVKDMEIFFTSKGFIDGWNQALDKILSEFESNPLKYSPTPNQYLKIKELKVKVEK